MSVFDGVDLEGAKEASIVSANEEVKLRILSVKKDVDKNGLDYVMPLFEIQGGDGYYKDFSKFLTIPNKNAKDSMELKKFENARFTLSEFFKAFDIDASRPGDPEDWVGNEGWAILGVSKSDEYGDQNFIKRFVTPR